MNKGSVSVNYNRNISSEYIRKSLDPKKESPISELEQDTVNIPVEDPISNDNCSESISAPAAEPEVIPAAEECLQQINNEAPPAVRKTIDISGYLHMHYSEFIPLMYEVFFNRQPDGSGMASFIQMVRNGASNAAIAYVFAVSDEFSGRADVADLPLYKKQYKKYIRKLRIKHIPLFGRLAQLFALPSQLSTFYDNYEYYNGKHINTAAQLNEKYMGICADIDELNRRLNNIAEVSDDKFCKIYENMEALNRRLNIISSLTSENYNSLGRAMGELKGQLDQTAAVFSRNYESMGEKLDNTAAMLSENCGSMSEKLDKIAAMLSENYGSMSEKLDKTAAMLSENYGSMIEKLDKTAESFSENYRRLDSNIEELNKKMNGIAEDTRSFGKTADAIEQENRTAYEALNELADENSRITIGLHEKTDDLSRLITSVSQKTDALPEYIAGVSQKTKTAITGIPGGVISVMAGDFIFGVPSEEWGLAHYLSLNGHFEKGTEEAFCRLLKPGMNVLDIGANLGMFTLHALKAGCNVYSFEPSPSIFRIMNQNIKVNGFAESGRTHTFQNAVSDEERTVSFYVCDGMSGHSNIYAAEKENDTEVSVNTTVIDNMSELPGNVDIIKMDIEGAEYSALCGMKKLIAKNPGVKIFMEFAPEILDRACVEPSKLLKLIKDLGLNYYLIDESTGKFKSVSENELIDCFSVNLLLTKESIDL